MTILLVLFFAISCTSEEVYLANNDIENNYLDDEILEVIEGADSPCDFLLTDMQSDSTQYIDCLIDLEGATVNLPENITLEYEGGEIVNGTLNFSEGSTIDPNLVNPSLNIEGSQPYVKDVAFDFIPKRWGIVQGTVSLEVALRNKEILQMAIDQVKLMGINTFKIHEMDAFFHVGNVESLDANIFRRSISLPSDFKFVMTDNVTLRVQPNRFPRGTLIASHMKENVEIIGGNLYGDRYTHDYTPISDEFGIARNSHEWPSLISIAGSKNVVVDGVYMTDSTGDAFVYASGTNRQYTPAVYCQNVVVKNCTMNASRRNNVTFGDGENLTLENCIISNAGGGENIFGDDGKVAVYTSAGVAPQFGVDLEAHREKNAAGEYIDYQIVEDVDIRGNTFIGNYAGDIVIFTAHNVLIENNDFDSSIGGLLFNNVIIRNNRLVQRKTGVKKSVGIGNNVLLNDEGIHRVYNVEISGNYIEGYNTGISPAGRDMVIKNNTVRDFTEGIYFRDIVDSEISNNDYKSDRFISYGYLSYGGNTENVTISNDKIEVTHRPVNFFNFNRDADTSLTIKNTEIISPKELYIYNSNNVTLENNDLVNDNSITKTNSNNIVVN